ncbi:MAG: PDZ domain-containing protein [Candidatus Manganitrophus sp.]|nr:PDZ domain-containing protein [Candidatus Manganitrophus sp.]
MAEAFGLKESKGALVSDVLPDSPAEAAGIKRGDILLAIDGKEVESTAQLRKWVAGTAVGKKIRLTLFRDKKEKEIELSPGEQPQEVAQAGGEGAETETSALKGAQVRNLTPEAAREMNLPKGLEGVVISRVEAGSLAEEAGLRAGDVILEVNRTAVRNTREYEQALSRLKKEQSALLLIHRGGNTLFLTLDAA